MLDGCRCYFSNGTFLTQIVPKPSSLFPRAGGGLGLAERTHAGRHWVTKSLPVDTGRCLHTPGTEEEAVQPREAQGPAGGQGPGPVGVANRKSLPALAGPAGLRPWQGGREEATEKCYLGPPCKGEWQLQVSFPALLWS